MSKNISLPGGREVTYEEFTQLYNKLAEPFPKDQIEKLPKPIVGKDRNGQRPPRYQCKQGTQASADGYFCGGYHARAIHLDYVGHAGITERLNSVDPFWNIDFKKYDEKGVPVIDYANGVAYFTLTVLGISRTCIGDAGGKKLDGNGHKEMFGDAIRNGAMRFGVATYLWSKSEKAQQLREFPEGHTAEAVPARNWQQLYQQAHSQGAQSFMNFLNWAETQEDAPKEMIQQGRKIIEEAKAKAEAPIEGEIVNEAGN